MNLLRLASRTKLYWGLAAIFAIGVLTSPVSSKGNNIFLSYGNLLDVLRQVSTTGLVAAGMTAGDPDRRDRPLGRLDHGALQGGLRHAADGAGLDAGGGDGAAGAGAHRSSWCWRR